MTIQTTHKTAADARHAEIAEQAATIAATIQAAIEAGAPEDDEAAAAMIDMNAAAADPAAWIAEIGEDGAEWAMEQAENTAADMEAAYAPEWA